MCGSESEAQVTAGGVKRETDVSRKQQCEIGPVKGEFEFEICSAAKSGNDRAQKYSRYLMRKTSARMHIARLSYFYWQAE